MRAKQQPLFSEGTYPKIREFNNKPFRIGQKKCRIKSGTF
jgi:hypothetical protein